MCPSTSWSLSSFTRNIVFGRASMTSPSISIFSSFGKAGPRLLGAAWLAPLEGRLPGPLREEGVDRFLEVLGGEERCRDLADPGVGAADSVLQKGAHHLLRRRVR